MNKLNKGNLIPVYDTPAYFHMNNGVCRFRPYGARYYRNRIPPIQLKVAGTPSSVSVFLIDALTGVSTAGSSSLAQVHSTDTHSYITIYNTTPDLEFEQEFCGFFYLRIKVDNRNYYSEVFDNRRLAEYERWFQLFFWNVTDTDGVLYQAGYKQEILFSGQYAQPIIQVNQEKTSNGADEEFVNWSSTKTRVTIDLKDVADYMLPTLQTLGNFDMVMLRDIYSQQTIYINEATVSPRQQDDCLNIGQLSFLGEHLVKDACGQNEVLV